MPLGIENLDSRNSTGRTVAEVMSVCETHGTPLVLDLQHAFENAPDYDAAEFVALAADFASAALRSNGLSHLHVSGEIRVAGEQLECHASLLTATNSDAILDGLRAVNKICGGRLPPIILEGDYLPGVPYLTSPLDDDRQLELAETAALNMRAERELILREVFGQSAK